MPLRKRSKHSERRANLKPAAERLKKNLVPCEHWPACEGCPLIATPYKEQLVIKFRKIMAAFIETGFDHNFLQKITKPTRGSPLTLGYRNKAKWVLFPDGKNLKMGMYKPGTHEVIDMPHCSVHAPAINELSDFIRVKLIEHKVPCGPLSKESAPTLRYLIVRYSFREKKLLVVFVSSVEKVPGLEKVAEAVQSHPVWKDKVVSMVQNINADGGNVLLGEANRFFTKNFELTESMGPFRVPVGPLSFLQVNSLQASYLYKRVRELLGKGPFNSGLDLYSGVGLIAMHMAPFTKKVLAVEEVGPAALEAITAARRNRLHNILELCADSLEGIQTFVSEFGTPDWVVLNPPRKGCEESVLEAICARPPKKIVYVSCNPKTLARDIAYLMNKIPDFSLKTLEPVDMFPQTEHIECIALLENQNFRRNSKKASSSGRRLKTSQATKQLH
jgi:23S rRNA (uracil1939-C5)-methyltransferase